MSSDSSSLQSSAVINEAVQTLRDGGLVAFPTETVYGLGADAKNPDAVKRIFTAKADHPIIRSLSIWQPLISLINPKSIGFQFYRPG